MKIAFILDTHRAVYRYRTSLLRKRFGSDNVLIGEWFKSSSIYHWESEPDDGCVTFSDKTDSQFLNQVQIFLKTKSFLKKNKIDVCLVFGYWPLRSVSVLMACLVKKIPCVCVSDSHHLSAKANAVGHFIKKAIVRRFSAALVGGPSQVSHYENLGIPKGRVFYGFDIIDNEFFSSRANAAKINTEETRRRLNLPQKYFLSLGRMVKKKNLRALVKAYSIAKQGRKLDADLVFVGSGECEEDLKNYALSLGLTVCDNPIKTCNNTGCVYFYCNQAADDLPSFYALAEAFVLPSQSEEWGLVVNEAMACGVPVIVSSMCGCAADLVHHGINGFRFDYDNAEELAKCLIEIGSSPDLARQMGQASLEIISKWDSNFFLKNVERAIESVYATSNAHK